MILQFWFPLKFENAREVEIVKQTVFSEHEIKLRGSYVLIRGKFFTAMNFKKYPHDSQVLSIAFSAGDQSSQGIPATQLVWHPVSAVYNQMVEHGSADVISGWTIKNVYGYEYSTKQSDDLLSEFIDLPNSPFYTLYKALKNAYGEATLLQIEKEINTSNKVSYAICDIIIERNTSYFVYNFIIMIGMFTILSWASFFIPAQELHERYLQYAICTSRHMCYLKIYLT